MALINTSSLHLASEALKELELSRSLPEEVQKLPKKAQLQHLLNRNGLGLSEIVENLRDISRGAEKEETRLKASELVLRLHDVLRDEKDLAATTIVFQFADSNVNLAFLKPFGA